MKNKVTQLFTVVALAAATPAAANPAKPPPAETQQPRTLPNGAPACGNVQIKGSRVQRCNTTTAVAPKPEPVKPGTTVRREETRTTLQMILTFFGGGSTPAVRPRELRNGSPANGNVQGRMARRAVEAPPKPVTSN